MVHLCSAHMEIFFVCDLLHEGEHFCSTFAGHLSHQSPPPSRRKDASYKRLGGRDG